MKRRMVAAIVLSTVLSVSLASRAGAAGGPSSGQATVGWLDRAIEWINRAVQPVWMLLEKDGGGGIKPTPTSGTPGSPTLDGGGCLDPLGGKPCG